MTMHQEWTDQLSDYLDDELQEGERAALEAHLRECAACTAVLNDLQRIMERARASANTARPPQADLWDGVAGRIERIRQPTRLTLTLSQLAAAAVVVAAVSGGLVWQFAPSLGNSNGTRSETPVTSQVAEAARSVDSGVDRRRDDVAVVGVSLADDQYDAAVADLEQALKQGRGKLDASTIAIVEQNLQTIDQAIAQAREALATDPANSYLTGHLVEARRRKLDLLRRATALTEMD
jgi:hypothetical protein